MKTFRAITIAAVVSLAFQNFSLAKPASNKPLNLDGAKVEVYKTASDYKLFIYIFNFTLN